MSNDKQHLWERFQKYYFEFPSLTLRTDLSRMQFADDFFEKMSPRMNAAFQEMDVLEAGGIANPDEQRMVGHYWLRKPALAPSPGIRAEIESTLARIHKFTTDVHAGLIQGQRGIFKNLLLIGIGGSSLGPQFVANALGHPKTNRMKPFFLDNTDSDGMERVLATIGHELGNTLNIVISKSGGTKETRNGMLECSAAYRTAGLDFNKHAIAITREESDLYKFAKQMTWLDIFPMWDWVGGRTSELSAVGLVPASLQGIDINEMISGAMTCDEITRKKKIHANPAAQLALMWFHAGNGKGTKNMVVLPYRDRLELFSKYLQQLIMESIGKELDRDGSQVRQGISVFGNKGSTDQHSYIQQLRDGKNDFFAIFIEVLRGQNSSGLLVESIATSDDYLSGFYLGTRQALTESGRETLSLTIDEVNPFSVGVLIALFERAVGFYAALINVNAYHQPGVEAGKRAAEFVIALQSKILYVLNNNPETAFSAEDLARRVGAITETEHVFKICERLATVPASQVFKQIGSEPKHVKFGISV